jgi:hypothetical protein
LAEVTLWNGFLLAGHMFVTAYNVSPDHQTRVLQEAFTRDTHVAMEVVEQVPFELDQVRLDKERQQTDDMLDKGIEIVGEGIERVVTQTQERGETKEAEDMHQKVVATNDVALDFAQREQELRARQDAEMKAKTDEMAKAHTNLETRLDKVPNGLPQEFRDAHLKDQADVAKAELDRMQAEHGAQIETLHAERQQAIDRVQTQQPQPVAPVQPPPPEDPSRGW